MAEEAGPRSPPPTSPAAVPLSPSKKENARPIDNKMAELNQSQAELATRLQVLKQELQSWRSKLTTQVKTYKDELSELKNSLSTEMEQIRSQFQELRATLQQQQEDVTNSLKNLGMQDLPKDVTGPSSPKAVEQEGKAEEKPEEIRTAVADTNESDS